MDIVSLLVLLIGLSVLILLVMVWLGARLQTLENRRTKVKHDTPLTKDQLAKLHDEAAQQYEATMVRELKRFEGEMTKMSNDLLGKLQGQIGTPQAQLASTIDGLLQTTTHGYADALDQAVAQLKARLATVDALIASHAEQADKAVQVMVDERKATALARIDASLGEMFADYMATVASGLDLSDQQALILQQLESIKPQLVEDIKRA